MSAGNTSTTNNNSYSQSQQQPSSSHHGQGLSAPVASASPNTGVLSSSANHSNHPTYPNSGNNQSGQNNHLSINAGNNSVVSNSQVGASNAPSNLSNIMSTNASTSF